MVKRAFSGGNLVLRTNRFGILLGLLTLPTILAFGVVKPDFKPSYNFYSPQDDVQLGKESALQVDKQLPLLRDPEALKYLNTMARRLVAFAPNNRSEYAWQFKIV